MLYFGSLSSLYLCRHLCNTHFIILVRVMKKQKIPVRINLNLSITDSLPDRIKIDYIYKVLPNCK